MRGPDSVSRCRQFQRNVRLAFRVDGVDCRLQRGECVQLVHVAQGGGEGFRSEEHTSELQSLMRISYAVFCLNNNSREIGRAHVRTSSTQAHLACRLLREK